ncbi:MAG: signal peptidase I, partial [Woeseia sp.]
MNINLALLLTVLTAISGVIVAYNMFVVQKRSHPPGAVEGAAIEYAQSFFPVLLMVLVIRSFVFEPFRIPSGSMNPTLLQGDFIFVKKYTYGLRLPVLETKIIETGEPERGDVVVFRLPSDPSINYIKRVVGLPGDKIQYSDHQLMINGELMPLATGDVSAEFPGSLQFTEVLGEREHEILVRNPGSMAPEQHYTVPEGAYFMMGDNRDNSQDSRYIGTVPETHLV